MEDFVSFEIAKKLKEKGFIELCLACYIDDTLYYNYSNKNRVCYKDCYLSHNLMPECSVSDKFVDAPTISQVLKWLREEKKIYVLIEVEYEDWFEYKIVQTIKGIRRSSTRVYETFEEAVLAGIEYVLDNLI